MEDSSFKYIVYCTTCIVTKKIYIGVHKTQNPNVFDGYIGCGCYANSPCTYNKPKTKLQQAINEYGPKKFIRNTIAVFDTDEEAFQLEKAIVTKEFLKRNDVYNQVLGGSGGFTASVPVFEYTEQGVFIKEYPSINGAACANNVDFRSIYRAIDEKIKCKGHFWTKVKFEQLDITKMYQYTGLPKQPIFQYSLDGTYDCCYDSLHDASRVLHIHHTNISTAAKLGTRCCDKYFTFTYAPNFSQARNTQVNSSSVHQYDLDGNYIASFNSMAEAKKATGIKSDIYKAIKLGHTVGNFQWSFEKLNKIAPNELPKSGKAKQVGKYDKDWNLIKIYPTLAACKKENGSGMQHVISGRDEFAKGFRYKYIEQN